MDALGFICTNPGSDRPDVQLYFRTGRANTQAASGFTGHGFLTHVCELRPGSILRVHGVDGLRVVNASAMPSIVSGNAVAATYCIAAKAADLTLLDRVGDSHTDQSRARGVLVAITAQ